MDNNYPPYAFLDEQGNMQGITVDQWRLWEERTNVNVEITGLDWGTALERMRAGEFDVIDTIFYTPERAKIFDYTKPYADIDVRIFFQKNISGIATAENLKGFRVAVKAGDANADYLLEQGITSLVYYNSYEEIVQAIASNNETIFVVDQPPGLYFLYKYGIQNEFNFSEPLYGGEFHRAVKKGNKEILNLVNTGFSSITSSEKQSINNRWFGTQRSDVFSNIMPYLGAGATLALSVIAALMLFNRTLQARIKERAEKLQNSAAQYRAVVENQTEFIVRCKLDGTRTFVNEAYCRHFGVTEEEAIGTNFFNLVEKDHRPSIIEKYARLESGAVDTETDIHQVINPDGSIGWQEWTDHAIRDESGRVVEIQSVGRDITNTKRTQTELLEEKDFTEHALNSLVDTFFVFKLSTGKAVRWNKAFSNISGYSDEEIKSLKAPDSYYSEDDLEKATEAIQQVLKGGTATVELALLTKDNRAIPTEYTATLIKDAKNNPEYVIAIGRDTTKRRQAESALRDSEQRLRAIVNEAPFGAHLYQLEDNDQLVFIGANRSADQILNTDHNRLVGKSIEEAFPPLVKTEIPTAYRQVATSGERFNLDQVIYDDGEISGAFEIHAFKTGEGRMSVFFRDITERKRAEEALQDSEKRYRAIFEDSPVPLMEEDFSDVKIYVDKLKKSGVNDFRDYFISHPEATRHCIDMVKIVDVNKTAVHWNGRKNKYELLGSLGQYISADDHESFLDELVKLIEDGSRYETVVSRHAQSGEPLHLIVNGTVAPGYEDTWGRVLVSVLDITERKNAEEKLTKAYDTTLWGWAKALEFRDKETEGHSRRVVEITLKLAKALGITDEEELTNIRRGTILHDIGKLSIPDDILLKPGKLTESEWQIMCQHPWLGYKLLAPIEFLNGSLDIVRYHHEKWDGSGYLSGLKGEEIPLAARIFAVVDVWDAVQAERPYKKAWSKTKAIKHLQAQTGKQFDPAIVKVFLDLVEQGKI